jgi:transposase-like protein
LRTCLGTRLGLFRNGIWRPLSISELSTPKRARVTWSTEERADWVRMFEKSGKSLTDFCRENDLPDATMSLWRRQLRGAEPAIEEPPLVEVTMPMTNLLVNRPALRARLPGGIELEVESGTDAQWLAGVLRALMPADV